ncbi:hypothetical protein C0991_002761 [Blastosporella zonata]|nr:hypothetical protein C0991_002761 [Blastosporella zonata]
MLGFPGAADQSNGNPLQTMRLAQDDSQIVNPAQRQSKKRKTPPQSVPDHQPPPSGPPLPPPTQIHHVLPPMMHPMQPLPPGYHYDFTPGGMPPPPPHQHPDQQNHQGNSPPPSAANRALSSSKRAEQNRKAQRAFRERRDQHVKALESRSQLLDAALSSADEANRRWEECRVLVDQLRIENTALRAALNAAQIIPGPPPPHQQQQQQGGIPEANDHGAQQQLEEAKRSLEAVVHNELKNDSSDLHKTD